LFNGLDQTLNAHSRPYAASYRTYVTPHKDHGDAAPGEDGQCCKTSSLVLWGRDALWLHEFDSDTEEVPHGNKWLSEANASWPHRTPTLLRTTGWDTEANTSEECSDRENADRFHLSEIGIKLLRAALQPVKTVACRV
uniref:Sulfatase domain-containing protein n=1 Tax=Echinostoma caproni TaxID=27848 RepID=A0A183A0V9_9TREM